VISISSISMIGRFYNPENAFRYAWSSGCFPFEISI
jgi:hypothetical protein